LATATYVGSDDKFHAGESSRLIFPQIRDFLVLLGLLITDWSCEKFGLYMHNNSPHSAARVHSVLAVFLQKWPDLNLIQ
jgi:hypothetical protein